jgi:hypothetical protein
MHTREGVQLSFDGPEIKVEAGAMTVRGVLQLQLSMPAQGERLLEEMERGVEEGGQELKRELFRLMVEKADTELVLAQRSGKERVTMRGTRRLTCKSVFGTVRVSRRRVEDHSTGRVTTPCATVWNTPRQVLITRGLRDLVCDVVGEESVRDTLRRIEHHSGEKKLLSPTTIMEIFHAEGTDLDAAAKARAESVFMESPEARTMLLPAGALPEAVNDPEVEAKKGTERCAEAPIPADEEYESLIGFDGRESVEVVSEKEPRVVDNHCVVVQADEVKVKAQPCTGRADILVFTAVVMTATTTWKLVAGCTGDLWLQVGAVLATLDVHRGNMRLLALADGARWIRAWYEALPLSRKDMVLCWYHLAKRCGVSLSRTARGKEHRNQVLHALLDLLWEGKIDEGLALLDSRREEMRSPKHIDELKTYLETRRPYLPNYRARKQAGLWIASNRVEKLNDGCVSERCKGRGMAWTLDGVLSLAALHAAESNDELVAWRANRYLPGRPTEPALCLAA